MASKRAFSVGDHRTLELTCASKRLGLQSMLVGTMFATRNKCIASSNKCLTSSNKKLLGVAILLGARTLLVAIGIVSAKGKQALPKS